MPVIPDRGRGSGQHSKTQPQKEGRGRWEEGGKGGGVGEGEKNNYFTLKRGKITCGDINLSLLAIQSAETLIYHYCHTVCI